MAREVSRPKTEQDPLQKQNSQFIVVKLIFLRFVEKFSKKYVLASYCKIWKKN